MIIDRRITPSRFYAPFRIPPKNLSRNAKAGNGISLGYRHSSWVLDGDDTAGYRFYFDSAGDGDFSNEQPRLLTQNGASWEATIVAQGQTPDEKPTDLVFKVRVRGPDLIVEYTNIRTGHVTVAGRTLNFGIIGISGYYGLGSQRIVFDRNRDGKLDLDDSAYGNEWLYNRDQVVRLFGETYEFSMDRAGSSLKLVRSDRSSGTPNLSLGNAAPEFDLVGIDGKGISSTELRGQYVVIDFWSMACPPCVRDIPAIADLIVNAKKPVAVVGVTPDDDQNRLRQFVAHHSVTWPVVHESLDNGSTYSAFRVERFPFYVVIGADGALLCLGCTLGEVTQILDQ